MKILLVGDEQLIEKTIPKIIAHNLTERGNIFLKNNIETAKEFSQNFLINRQAPFDLIIADDNTEWYQKNLCEWIRNSQECFSNHDFRLASIPLILCKRGIGYSERINFLYDAVIPFSEGENDLRIIEASKKVVKNFREKIPTDLDILGIKNSDLKAYDKNYKLNFPDYAINARNPDSFLIKTKILSGTFIQNPKSLNYDWIIPEKKEIILQSLEEYDKIIYNRHNYRGKYFEVQVLHPLYNKFPNLLCSDIFEKQTYNIRYYIKSTLPKGWHNPDFVLLSPFATSITEIKNHNVKFEGSPIRHDNFSSYTQKALNQVSNYEDDFKAKATPSYLQSRIAYNSCSSNIQVDLIIGLEENLTEYARKKIEKHHPSINYITHDLKLNRAENHLKRFSDMSIF